MARHVRKGDRAEGGQGGARDGRGDARDERGTRDVDDATDARKDAALEKHASQASALLAARAAARRGQAGHGTRWEPGQQAGARSRSAGAREQSSDGRAQPASARERATDVQRQPASARRQPAGARERATDAQQQPAGTQHYPQTVSEFMGQNLRYVVGAVAVVLVVVAGLLILRYFVTATHTPLTPETSTASAHRYESPYDWTRLDRTDGRFSYVVDGEVKSRLGIDVSDSQGTIDWNAVAADGIDFAIIRVGYRGATEGELYLDQQFWNNIDGARAAGLDCGAYFFSQARTPEEATEEADFVLKYLNGTPLEYPIAFDSEEVALKSGTSRTAGLSKDEMTAAAEAFCDRVERGGYRSMVYGNAIDLSRFHYANLEQRRIWWAEYGVPSPIPGVDIAYWQYSNEGSVAGISTVVDMDIDLSRVLE